MNDINTNIDTETKPGLNRRRFLEYFAAVGISASMLPGCGKKDNGETGKSGEITVETIEAGEKIMGITLTPQEREKIVESLNKQVELFDDLREKKVDNSENNALVFNPIPPGMTIPTEKKPARFSEATVKKPAKIEDAAFYSVLQLAKLIETRQITSTELTKMYLARLKKYNPALNCVVSLTEDLALKQAKRADDEIKAGKYRGLLHGLPYGAKDLFAVKGYKTTWGAEAYKNQIIDKNATVIERLEEAGAVLLAKLSLGALATGDVWFKGKTRSPWNTEKGSSGSSAGSASATGAGCVAFALGTETSGSIISPCDRCGTTGLRPTFGRISRYGAMALSWSMDKVGPICRTVEDCAVVFNALLGPDGKDNTVNDYPFNWEPGIDLKKVRIGYYRKYFEKELIRNPKDEKAKTYYKKRQAVSRKVLDVMKKLGVDLIPLDFDIPLSGARLILTTESAAAFDDLTRSKRDDMIKDSHWPETFRKRRFVPAVEYIQANRYRTRLIEQVNKAIENVDVFIEITHSNTHLTNLTGHPAVALPCGFVDGMPVSIVFTGKLFGEVELLTAAKAYQDATDFHLKHPKLA